MTARSSLRYFLSTAVLSLLLSVVVVQAQNGKIGTLDVFLDCSSCDVNLIRQKLDYVNYTNDPFTAQIHLFITRTTLGSGGTVYQLRLIGKKEFDGDQLKLEAEVPPNNSHLEGQEILINSLELGLVPFVARTAMQQQLSVSVDRDKAKQPVSTPQNNWNNWIFELYSNLDWQKETLTETINFRYGVNIDHVTPDWRVRITPSFFYRERYVENNGEIILAVRRNNYFSSSVVKSISDHWSVGLFNSILNSTYSNIGLGTWLAPAMEYNVFSYSEVPLKEFTIAYRVGWRRNDYIQETIFLKSEEDLIQQMLDVRLQLRQPWGSVLAGVAGSNYMDDWEKNRLEMNGQVSFRLIRGLAVRVGGNFELINDQISLPRGDASLEDILLGQRQLATNFDASLNFGFSYTFGALYNNIINTRL